MLFVFPPLSSLGIKYRQKIYNLTNYITWACKVKDLIYFMLDCFLQQAYNENRQKKAPNYTKKVRGCSHTGETSCSGVTDRTNIKPIIKNSKRKIKNIKMFHKSSIPSVTSFV